MEKCKTCEYYGETFDNWCDAFDCEVNENDKACETFHPKGAQPVNYDAIEKMLKDGKL